MRRDKGIEMGLGVGFMMVIVASEVGILLGRDGFKGEYSRFEHGNEQTRTW